MKKLNSYISGAIGGFGVVGILLIIYFALGLTDKQLVFQPQYIESAIYVDKPDDSTYKEISSLSREQIIQFIKDDKLILSPKEYTSNVVDYYNVAFLILSAMLVIFTMLSFIHIKTSMKEAFQDLLESKKFQQEIADILIGRAEENIGNSFEELEKKMDNKHQCLLRKMKDQTKQIDELKIQISNLENPATEIDIEETT